MMKVIKVMLLFGMLSFFSGCIEVDINVKLKPDGSGVIEEKVLIGEGLIEMFSSFMMMSDDSSNQASFNLFDEKELKSQAAEMGEGVRYMKGEKLTDGKREGYYAVYEFDDINKIILDQNPNSKVPADDMMGMEEDEKEPITFKFQKSPESKLTVKFPHDKKYDETDNEIELEESEDSSFGDEESLEMAKKLFKDFRMKIGLEVAGEIVETNASHINGNKITFMELDFGKLLDMPEKFKELERLKPNSLSEIKELLKDIPGIKFEIGEQIEVTFK